MDCDVLDNIHPTTAVDCRKDALQPRHQTLSLPRVSQSHVTGVRHPEPKDATGSSLVTVYFVPVLNR